jgi:hypothetical protein
VAARSRKYREASLARADGVVSNLNKNSAEFDHHPVRSKKEASRYLVEVASTLLGEEGEIANSGFGQQLLAPVAKICHRAAAQLKPADCIGYLILVPDLIIAGCIDDG